MDIQQNIFAIDNLNLYLVTRELKPATMILLNSLNNKIQTKYDKHKIKCTTIKTNPHEITEFRKKLDKLKTFHEMKHFKRTYFTDKKEKITAFFEIFNIAKTEQTLQQLITARTDCELGIALGYPEKAVKNYLKLINGEQRDGTYLQVNLAKAKQASIPIPPWLAYISHIPEELDIVNNKIAPTTKKIGETYRNYTIKNKPELAKIVEEEFKNTSLPIDWIKQSDGSYHLTYAPEKQIN